MAQRPYDDLEGVGSAAAAARRRIIDTRKERLRRLGEKFFEMSAADYDTKSMGGEGLDGIRWEENPDSTKKIKGREDIGVRSRRQRAAADPGGSPDTVFDIAEDTVDVGYGAEYSGEFDLKRQLIPDPLPPEYVDPLEEIEREAIEEILDQEFGK